jgi:membrane-associated phospholipid phosphatase
VHPVPLTIRMWLLALAACAGLIVLSFSRIDVPLAQHFWNVAGFLRPLNTAFGATVVLSLESVVTLGLVFARLIRGRLPRSGEALAIACLASICTYGINDAVLKPCFGVPVPGAVMAGTIHAFHFLAGAGNFSFPSGHMALAGSFAGVFISLYRVSLLPLIVLLLLAGALLVIGDWHFLSDVVAGGFVGLSSGMLAGGAWSLHSEEPSWLFKTR